MKTKSPTPKRREKQRWPFIKKRTYSTGAVGWTVDSRTKTGGERKTFETLQEAETHAGKCRITRGNEGVGAFQNADLAKFGKTTQDAITFYLDYLRQLEKSVPLEGAIEELLALKKTAGRSDRYRNDVKLRLKRLKGAFQGRTVATITTKELDAWLAGLEVAAGTRNTFRRDVKTLFAFCERRGYAPTNAAKHTHRAAHMAAAVTILDVRQSAALLAASGSDTVLYNAVALFAGLRPSEIMRLEWSHITFKGGKMGAGEIDVVRQLGTKTAKDRIVDILPNLKKWLLPHRKLAGAVVDPVGLRDRNDAVRRKVGWGTPGSETPEEKAKGVALAYWPEDVMRHTFGSHLLAKTQDQAAVRNQMGNTDDVFVKHYRKKVSASEAARFWKLAPAPKASRKIVQMAA